MNRRDLLKAAGITAAGAGLCGFLPFLRRQRPEETSEPDESGDAGVEEKSATKQARTLPDGVEARHYRARDDGTVVCKLCFRKCAVIDGGRGSCRNRINSGGTMETLLYGRPSAVAVEPTEKEPLHHFLPGTNVLCIGTAGCNFHCKFCHNWHLSQRGVEEVGRYFTLTPAEMVDLAGRHEVPAISFTYNEPAVFYEYMYDIAVKARAEGLKTVFHSNGGMSRRPLEELLPHMDGATVDLKGFTQTYYEKLCEAELKPVLRTLETIKKSGTWLEIVNLVLPTHNDSPSEVRSMCKWIRDNLGSETPLHFSRFSPSYQMTNLPPTPVSTLERCRDIAAEVGIKFISIGNVPGHEANSTFCPGCGKRIIHRQHFTVIEIKVKDGACESCGRPIPGVWS